MKMIKTDKSLLRLSTAAMLAGLLVLAGCGGSGPQPPADTSADTLAADRTAIKNAIDAADAAVGMVDDDSTDAEVKEADDAITVARKAIADATSIPAAEKAANTGRVDSIAARLKAAKDDRMMAMDDARKAENAAMMAMAKKLYNGIKAPMGDGTGADDRHATYGTGDDADKIVVTFGDGTTAGTAQNLSEDKKTMVAAHHGWEGKKYMASGTDVDGTYEAVVYSNVGESTPGAKISTLLTGGVIPDGSTVAANVASPSFDHSAGVKPFKLPDPNPTSQSVIVISGSYSGVAGSYSCTPGANTCAVQVAAKGFTLGGLTDPDDATTFTAGNAAWTFKPTNPEARIMSVPDDLYASYGWWIHKSENGMTYTASTFHDLKGTATATVDLPEAGTATYMGGAVGKYALHSSTGGTNDSGDFTAKATLEADFGASNANTITGTIDDFKGADGMSRDWSVELKEADAADGGVITAAKTVWTIGGDAASDSGEWLGNFREQGDDGVPGVVTGTFHSTYGNAGNMVGAFGANEE